MSSKQDKTEKATPQRRRQAREEGQIARSAEVSVFAALALGALTMRVFLPSGTAAFASQVRTSLDTLDPAQLPTFSSLSGLLSAVALLLLPFLVMAVVGALGAGFSMTRFNVSLKAAKPKWSKISPKQGIQRFKPAAAGWELLRTLIKVGALFVVAWDPLARITSRLAGGHGVDAAVGIVADEAWTILLRGIAVSFVIAAADYVYNNRKQERDMRMSRQDLKDENRNSEGDPLVKGERRRRQQQLSRNRMLADVATADVVLVNPTDYAIALRYDPGESAPKVLAKGADHLAAKIRKEAARHGVPVHVDIPLCRALYRQVQVGGVVPRAMYDAIAVVLVWAYRRTGRTPGARASSTTATARPLQMGAR